MAHSVELTVRVSRKQADLPRFAVVPARVLREWALTGTTTVNVTINGVAVEPRTIRQWGEDRWFLSITQKDCSRVGVDTGTRVRLTLELASAALPVELATLLRADAAAAEAWKRLTPAQQRMLRDEIASAKRAATRQRRAQRALLGPGRTQAGAGESLSDQPDRAQPSSSRSR